jgi:hypothetical protein
MAKVTEISEHFQHFVSKLQDSFLGRYVWPDAGGVAAVLEYGIASGTRPADGTGPAWKNRSLKLFTQAA